MSTLYTNMVRSQQLSLPRSLARLLGLATIIAVAIGAGFVAATTGPSGVFVFVSAIVIVPLMWLSIETLVGLWLVLALADPALPRVGGLSFSDIMLVFALAKLILGHGQLSRIPPKIAFILSIAWLSEMVLVTFGHSITSDNSRFLVTLAGMSAVVYVAGTSTRPLGWIRWLAIASATAAGLAVGQYVIYRSTGVLLFPKAQNLFFVRTGISNVFKATALGLDPNFLGMWMVPGFALGLVGLLRTKRRLLYGSLSLLCILGIMATGSRGALLSIVIGGATVGLIEASSAHRKVDARILRVTGLLIIAAVVAPFVVTVIAHAIARYPVTVNTRTEQVPIVLHDATSGNWTGKGYQAQLPQAASVGSPYVRQENVVHNTLLQALFEAGWLGFLVPLFMLLTGLTVALRLLHGAYDTESAMLGASFIVLAVNLQTLGAYAFRPFWFLWALLIAVGSIVMRSSTDTSSLSVSPKLSHYASQATSQAVLKRGHVLS